MNILDIIKATKGKAVNFKNIDISGISIDSRTIKKGEFFVAIKGERFDGHDFVEEAFKRGAAGAIVESQKLKVKSQNHILKSKNIIRVDDTLKALGDIAGSHRIKFNIPIIAITGSTGKTTAKEIISHILSKEYKVLKNEGTKNNLIGLPLTLLKLNNSHDIAILEMGTNHFGEIKRLSEIAIPTMGVITNIGPAHLEFFGSLENVFKAKSELLEKLGRRDLVLLNKDDEFLAEANTRCKKLYFGIKNSCDFQATCVEMKNKNITFKVEGVSFSITFVGRHNVYNALAGIGMGKIFGMGLKNIAENLKDFKNPFSDRLALFKNKKFLILNDTYNSNPPSFNKALETLVALEPERRKVIITADMLELGKESKLLHEGIGRDIAASGVRTLITLGPMSRHTSQAALRYGMDNEEIVHFASRQNLLKNLPHLLQEGDLVLVKGSRAMHMEEVVRSIEDL